MTIWSDLPDDIRAAEQERQRAMCDADIETLSTLLDDELIYIHSNGMRDGKASHLAGIAAGVVRYMDMELKRLTCIRLSQAVWIVNGRLQASAAVAGTLVAIDAAFTAVWRCGAMWRLVAWQSTPWPTETMPAAKTEFAR